MKKIGIITIVDKTPNFGNRLQNYAMEQIFKNYCDEVFTVSADQKMVNIKMKIKYFLRIILKEKLGERYFYWKYDLDRRLKFDRFNKDYLNIRYIKSDKKINSKADVFVLGSDQVWNPSWNYDNEISRKLFLMEGIDSSKKLTYAPSIGLDTFPERWVEPFTKCFMNIKHISIREKSGASLIYKLVKRRVEVVVDPTLLIDTEVWKGISRKPSNIDLSKEYIFTYFLGDKNEYVDSIINECSIDNKLFVYHAFDKNDLQCFTLDPNEFLYMIKNAKIVMTDSFHACVFSFLFGKPFLIFDREGREKKMMSRIDDFLNMFNLQRKYINNVKENDIFECDYSVGYTVLENERKKAFKYIEMSLKDIGII